MEHDLRGKLNCFTLSDIIQLLSFSGQAGTLTLIQGWNSRTITFERGRITYIAAATKLSTVDELLLKAGRITEQQMRDSADQSRASGQPLVDLLVSKKIVAMADVLRCREQQLEETIYSLFLWRNCEFSFDSNTVHKEDGIPVDIAGERLIMEGTRRVDEWIAISPVIPSVRMIFQAVKSDGLKERPAEEQLVYAQVDGIRDVEAIAQAAGMTQFDAARMLFQLVCAGLVRAMPPDRVRIIELFKFLGESIFIKLLMYGHSAIAVEFQNQLNRFARDHRLKIRMSGGKINTSDLDLAIETTALIDLYKLFMAIERNKFAKIFEPEIVHGLVEGLYLHVDARFQDMMRMYDFYEIEGLLKGKGQVPEPVLVPSWGRG